MTRPPSQAQTWALFLLLSAIWGSSYLFIKIGLEQGMTPITLVALRTLLGTAFLAVVMRWQRASLPRSARLWIVLGIVGLTNIVVPYVLITWGELHISSGMAGILTAMVPLFTALLAWLTLSDEPLTLRKLVGLVVGFVGVLVLAWPSVGAMLGGDDALAVAGMVAVVLATLSYAVAAVVARRRLTGRPEVPRPDGTLGAPSPLQVSFGQSLVAMLVIGVLALAFERPEGGLLALPQTAEAWGAMLWLGFLGSGVSFLLYFAIIKRWGATRATLIAYVMPVVAIVLGFVVLGERLRPLELVGAALIIAGVVLVNARVGRRPRLGRSGSGMEATAAASDS